MDYKSAVKLDIPPAYKDLSANLPSEAKEIKIIAGLFLKNLDSPTGQSKLAVKYETNGQVLIYLLDRVDNSIRKRQINPSGTLLEYTWPGRCMERLAYAIENNNFDLPGSAVVELKNLYH